MRDEQNALLAEETNIKLRSCNFLTHRVAESTIAEKHQAQQRDEKYVSNFLQTLGVNKEYKATYRLGENRRNERAICATNQSSHAQR